MPSFREPAIVERAIRCFQAQTYGPKELVVLRTDGWRPDTYDQQVRTSRVPPGLSIGELRNVACRLARGSVLAFWDDDDVSHPDRLARSVAEIDTGADLVGTSRVVYEDPSAGKRYLFDGSAFKPKYMLGGTFVFRRELWEKYKFRDVRTGEDSRFYASVNGMGYLVIDLEDESLYTATISPDATSPKDTSGPGWSELT